MEDQAVTLASCLPTHLTMRLPISALLSVDPIPCARSRYPYFIIMHYLLLVLFAVQLLLTYILSFSKERRKPKYAGVHPPFGVCTV